MRSMNIKICVTGNKMFANSRLLCYVVTISSIILMSRVQFAQALEFWACPVHVGKLGPMLKTNVTLESCTFDNRTSPSTSSCCKPQSEECLRGEHAFLSLGCDRHNTSLFRNLVATFYGREICFAYGPFMDCGSKCVDVTATNIPWLYTEKSMTCNEVNGSPSCRGFIEYIKVTINKGTFDTRSYTDQVCNPRRGKDGNKESVALKIQDCIKVTSSSEETSTRCDDVEVIKTEDIAAGNINWRQELVMKRGGNVTKFRVPSGRERMFAYFEGDDFCVAVLYREVNINALSVYDPVSVCRYACMSYKSTKPIELVLYNMTYDIRRNIFDNSTWYQSETVKTLRFVASATSIEASTVLKICLPVLSILLTRHF